LSQAIACWYCRQHFAVRRSKAQTSGPPRNAAAAMTFSIIVKLEIFTKQISSQWALDFFSEMAVIAALQPLCGLDSADRRAMPAILFCLVNSN
jgi:hypothetical protein